MGRLPFAAPASVPVESFRHEAFLYSGDEDFVAGTSAFVRGALEADEAVLVAVVEPRVSLLQRELGRDADRVEFLDMAAVGRNPARIIPAWQDWVDRHAPHARGFRGIGEPIWAGRTAGEIVECQQHEWLLNTAFDDGPGWWLLCPYDAGALSAPVIERAHDTHPSVIAGDTREPSATYGRAASTLFGEPLEEPPKAVRELHFDLDGLGALRDYVAGFAASVVGARVAADAVLVVAELAANSIKYGGGSGVLRLWHEDAALVCEVRDRGVITDPLAGRRRPTLATRGKAGLWITNQLCDLLQIRSAPGDGTVVRARLGDVEGAAKSPVAQPPSIFSTASSASP
jgi:anti-sigma regulatory factor (Ser/Thr protein kinase)